MAVVVLAAWSLFGLACYGWARLIRHLSRAIHSHWSLTTGIGLAVVLALGGVLNALHMATAPAVLALVAAGLVLAGYFLRRTGRTSIRAGLTDRRAVYGVVAILVLFTVATQLPPAAYNYADDYGKYFLHPLLMLARGTVFGSPLSDLGSETLGGKAFLDAFTVALFPIRFINVSDAVFGLGLCLLLAGCAVPKARVLTGVGCTLAVLFIEPQYLNISALYLGSALMMTAVLLAADPDKPAPPLAMGLVYAGLVSLKTSFALFVPLHLALAVMGYLIAGQRPLNVLRWAALTTAAGLLGLAPWLLTHLPHYLDGLRAPVALIHPTTGPLDGFRLFSAEGLSFGGSALQFSLVVLAALAVAAALMGTSGRRGAPAAMASICAVACYGAMIFLFGPALAGYANAFRYFTPFAIGILPAVIALTAATWDGDLRLRRIALAAAILPLAVFAPSFLARAGQALNDGHTLAIAQYVDTSEYQAFNDHVLGGGAAADVAKWQAMVPAGEPIYVWVNAPFAFDQQRNPVFDIDTAGLATPWAKFPTRGYVIYEFGGYASPIIDDNPALPEVYGVHERLVAAQKRQFDARLNALAKSGAAVFQDGNVMILMLPGTDSAIKL